VKLGRLDPKKARPVKDAIEEAIIHGLYVLLSGLAAFAGIPDLRILYTAGISAALVGITTYAQVRRIKVGEAT